MIIYLRGVPGEHGEVGIISEDMASGPVVIKGNLLNIIWNELIDSKD